MTLEDIEKKEEKLPFSSGEAGPQVLSSVSSPSEFQVQIGPPGEAIKRKKPILVVAIGIFLLIILVGGGLLYYQNYQGSVSQNGPESYVQPSALLTPLFSFTPPVVKEEKLEVQYVPREKILAPVSLPSEDFEEDFEAFSFEFYKIGKITSGKYKEGELILALITFGGPCKGRGCGKPFRRRYIKVGNQVIFLPRNSYPLRHFGAGASLEAKANPFSKFGLDLKIDEDFTVPIFEYPEKIFSQDTSAEINFGGEEDGVSDLTKLNLAFHHVTLEDVLMTKPGLGPKESFYDPGPGLLAIADDPTVGGCGGVNCFLTNGFFIFRPDGTFLKYYYVPYFSEKDIQWTDESPSESKYIYQTIAGCSHVGYDYHTVVPPEIADDDLKIIGKVKPTGEAIYDLNDPGHQLYTEFYNNYKENYPKWAEMSYGSYYDSPLPKSYEEFLASRPLFLWKDPFGRLIRFNNTDFLPGLFCEPIIYLYPERKQEIEVKLGSCLTINDSTPAYQDGWRLIADSSGKIIDTKNSQSYPYLFWEGWSYVFPMRKEGFVVRQKEVKGFFQDILPRLGLNRRETSDFLEAWLPYFSDSPYYFITFIDQEIVDRIAPLEVTPKPDVIIRILMDYKPLDEPIGISEYKIPEVPHREGFTIVEWGGLRRR